MSLQDRMSASILQKLTDMKKDLPKEELTEKDVLNEEEEEQIKQELLRQAEQEDEGDGIDDDFFTSLSAPSQEDGNEKLVEVEYLGRIGYVDISFENLDEDMDEKEYRNILDALEVMAFGDALLKRKEASKEVEKYGEKAITVIFRECRKFDLSDEKRKNELVHLLSRLTSRSLKGRKILKAVLEKANSTQHIALAILGSGAVREQEAVPGILNHMLSPDFFAIGLEALIKIRDKNSVEPIIKRLNDLDSNRNDMIDHAIQIAPRFADFGPEAVKPFFIAYINNQKKSIRPILTIALRSFKEDAIPVLSEVLEKETDENKLIPICMTLGALKMSYSTNLLLDSFRKYPVKRKAIIRGLSYTRDQSVLPLLVEELKSTEDIRLKQECLGAIAYLADNDMSLIPVVKPYLNERRNKLYLDALNCMVRLGDRESFDKFVNLLINGDEGEQYVLQKHVPKMSFKIIVKLAQKMLNCPDDKAILLVSALQNGNIIPQEVGPILQKKLDQQPIPALKLEIFRLIGKHVNKKRELLSQDILYKARQEETNPRVVRELDQIINNMRKEKGRISTIREEE
ncbi:HEAT repeat domain-containing protein [Bacillus sp. REN3]|uniref:HEAT repeat domain-containing protein n=1 Tax=Bacillus sp. REN3 TaxID=2802440 RepID=UPI001AEF205E|nr:HEAT repeat domain-containing protein [Bacillus sp. REN3]